MTLIFGENLGIGVIQRVGGGGEALDNEKMTRIMINEIIGYNKNHRIPIP